MMIRRGGGEEEAQDGSVIQLDYILQTPVVFPEHPCCNNDNCFTE